jgi:hypothetical protein
MTEPTNKPDESLPVSCEKCPIRIVCHVSPGYGNQLCIQAWRAIAAVPVGADYFARADLAGFEHRAVSASLTTQQFFRRLLDCYSEREIVEKQDEAIDKIRQDMAGRDEPKPAVSEGEGD